MKKLPILCLILATAFFTLRAGPLASTATVQQELTRTLGINVQGGREIESHDTHGGFHGDGLMFTALEFADDTAAVQASASSNWQPLPLSPTLTALAYGSDSGPIRSGPYLTDSNGKSVLPAIQNGYYFFRDRHTQSTDSRDERDVLSRGSFNFTLALYDTDTNMLYYIEYDT